MKVSHVACLLVSGLVLSCADSEGPVTVDAEWNLTCPDDSGVGCGTLATETCLGQVGQRTIVGADRDTACTGDMIDASCEAVQRPSGATQIFLEVNVGDAFAFELDGAAVDGSPEQTTCSVTIIEDGLDYGGMVTGGCGPDAPSVEQPCQLSNVEATGGVVSFDLECESLISSTTANGFDVGGVGSEPATFQFTNCTGL